MRGTFPDALGDAGLPPALADAAPDPGLDGAVRASTAEGAALVGEPEPSSPVVAVSGAGGERFAFSGPVLSRVPRGEDAGRLWEGVVLTASVDGFHALRGRPRADPDPDFEIG
ncbi:hypothetical protein [Actinomadura atramentaria]|uniref:mycothiol-dependent nitroreductase Rv2466c family protein n=1 Tax=Actinomadura atramentaria TaxID=1990 RepID=UPI00037212E5|nr:hypothetical protein [Actinomadura atramentaria]